MVTQLPSTGTLGCDTSDLLMIHTFFRSVYGAAPALVAAVADGDAAQAEVVGSHIADIADQLHHHHHGEDLLLWDTLEARNPACAAHVGQMRAQHAGVAAELEKLTSALAAWRASGTGTDRDAVGGILATINTLLFAHLGQEEKEIMPVAAVAMSQVEWDQLGVHGRASVPKDKQFVQLGFILESMPEAARAPWIKQNLPAPIRLLWKLVGTKQYAKHRAAVYGVAA